MSNYQYTPVPDDMDEGDFGHVENHRLLAETLNAVQQYLVTTGVVGPQGPDGRSSYEVAVANGFAGDEAAWLASLVGMPGPAGEPGAPGLMGASAYAIAVNEGGFEGTVGQWLQSLVGPAGVTPWTWRGFYDATMPYTYYDAVTYEGQTWMFLGEIAPGNPPSTANAVVLAAKGEPGIAGEPGGAGPAGPAGASAYAIAVNEGGFEGSIGQWIESLRGADGLPGERGADGAAGPAGPTGDSAYEVAVAAGFVGTESDWLASLVGPAGVDGDASGAIAAHETAADPHPGYLLEEAAVAMFDPAGAASAAEVAANSYADTAIAALVDSAPSTLNTLNEIAAALGNDTDLAGTLTSAIGAVSSDLAAHAAAEDPHPQYVTLAEVAAGTAVSGHEEAADPHPQYTTATEVEALIEAHATTVRSDVSGSYAYVGVAAGGSGTGESAWTVTRIALTSTITVATASAVAWDNRLTEVYS